MSRWYIIHAYSGFENKVRESIQSEAKRLGLERCVEQIEVPTETITEVKRGKKVQTERKTMPGYVLAKLSLSDDVYHLVKNTPKVTGFLGTNGKPQPISETEASRYFGAAEAAAAAPRKTISIDYEIGDSVKVLDGPFATFNGVVEELDFDKNRVKVSVSISSRRGRRPSLAMRPSGTLRSRSLVMRPPMSSRFSTPRAIDIRRMEPNRLMATGHGDRLPSWRMTFSNRSALPPPGCFMTRSAISHSSSFACTG
jgi:transcriptional antiterminator NusG